MCGCLLHALNQGPGLKPRHVPWLGIQSVTLWFAGRCSVHWATPARAQVSLYSGFPNMALTSPLTAGPDPNELPNDWQLLPIQEVQKPGGLLLFHPPRQAAFSNPVISHSPFYVQEEMAARSSYSFLSKLTLSSCPHWRLSWSMSSHLIPYRDFLTIH